MAFEIRYYNAHNKDDIQFVNSHVFFGTPCTKDEIDEILETPVKEFILFPFIYRFHVTVILLFY